MNWQFSSSRFYGIDAPISASLDDRSSLCGLAASVEMRAG
jgi:hypothetical protein